MAIMPETGGRRALRYLAIGTIIGLGAYWAGSRYGQRQPVSVSAVPANATPAKFSTASAVPAEANLDSTEVENVRIYRQASPSVANILTKAVEYDFFYNPVGVEGAGSGFLIDTDGHILTNNHVVQGAQTIEVAFGDHNTYKARFLGADAINDIALLQIDTKGRKLTPLPLGDSNKLLVGQRVLAIGNPFGFQSTLTTGVVSSLDRTVQTGENTFIDSAIQTDAAINRGNSGGPLLNSHGEVIGINSAIYAPNGTTAGIGFAIPINTAKRVAEDLISSGRVHRATIGAEGRTLWPDLASALSLPVQKGVLIERVEPAGAAAKAGLRGGNKVVLAGLRELRIGGDVITAINGEAVTSQSDLNLLLNRVRPGDTVQVTIIRDGKKVNVPVKLGEG